MLCTAAPAAAGTASQSAGRRGLCWGLLPRRKGAH